MSSKKAPSAETLLKAARNANIMLPKGKKEALAAVESALETAEGEKSECLESLEAKYGTKEVTGKRKAEKPASASKGEDKSPAAAVLDEVWNVSKKEDRKTQGAKLVDIAKSRGVKMPEEDDAARMAAFKAFMGVKGQEGTFVVKDAVEFLEQQFGKDKNWVDPDQKTAKKKKPSTAKPCTCPENAGLAEAFDELADFAFKEGSKSAFVYKKIVTAIKDMPEPLRKAPKKGEVKGIGAKSIEKIAEFLETGKMQALEDKRADALA